LQVLECIFSFLPHGSTLWSCRLVSRAWNNFLLQSLRLRNRKKSGRSFLDYFILRSRSERYRDRFLSEFILTFGNTNPLPLANFQIDLYHLNEEDALGFVGRFGNSVEKLLFFWNIQQRPYPIDIIAKVLSGVQNLKQLGFRTWCDWTFHLISNQIYFNWIFGFKCQSIR